MMFISHKKMLTHYTANVYEKIER